MHCRVFLDPSQIAQVADGIILLKNVEINLTRMKSIEILKMCGTSHHLGKRAVDISAKGMVISPVYRHAALIRRSPRPEGVLGSSLRLRLAAPQLAPA